MKKCYLLLGINAMFMYEYYICDACKALQEECNSQYFISVINY